MFASLTLVVPSISLFVMEGSASVFRQFIFAGRPAIETTCVPMLAPLWPGGFSIGALWNSENVRCAYVEMCVFLLAKGMAGADTAMNALPVAIDVG